MGVFFFQNINVLSPPKILFALRGNSKENRKPFCGGEKWHQVAEKTKKQSKKKKEKEKQKTKNKIK